VKSWPWPNANEGDVATKKGNPHRGFATLQKAAAVVGKRFEYKLVWSMSRSC
jgi:hypothetical protein